MRYKYLLLLLVPVLLFSCKKEASSHLSSPGDPGNPTNPNVPSPVTGLLKEIVIPRLPSPYYHFEYDEERKPVFASFASGFTMYNISYDGNRIKEMQNNIVVNKDRLQYFYDNESRIIAVRLADSAGIVNNRLDFTYDGHQLIKAERKRKSGNTLITDRTMTFSYYPDGNLMDLITHYSALPGQMELTFTDHYEQYDDKINTDAFGLIHPEFFEHLVLLPGVILQNNNPGKLTHTGDGDNYKVDYTYTYNETNQPLNKAGDFVYTNGTKAGQHFQTNSFYTYY